MSNITNEQTGLDSRYPAYFVIALLFTWVAFATAWLSDDIFISLRQVWNAINGQGYTWNYNQRVQAFTHPIWVIILTVAAFITKDLFYTTLFISIGLSLCAILVAIRHQLSLPGNGKAATWFSIFTLTCLAFSKAFTDYMTSGLENPLSYLLFGLCIYLADKLERKEHKAIEKIVIFIIMALIFLNRFDYSLILFPLAGYLILNGFNFRQSVISILPGAIIILCWFCFSVVYFGAPFPNTFYAKLATGYPPSEIYQRGVDYYANTFLKDPITLCLIALGIITGALSSRNVYRALSAGIILYCLYIITAGGDFMAGRFFSVIAYISVFNIVAFIAYSKRHNGVIISIALILLISISQGTIPALSSNDYSDTSTVNDIVDERGYYYQDFGLLAQQRNWPILKPPASHPPVNYSVICGGLGAIGLSNPDVYIIDTCGITDALISRLPAIQDPTWRIGHHHRKLPTNYGLHLLGAIPIADKDLDPMLTDITKVISGDLFTLDRFNAIVRLNITRPYLFDVSIYKNPDVSLPLVQRIPTNPNISPVFH